MRLYLITNYRASRGTTYPNTLSNLCQNADGATHAVQVLRTPPDKNSQVKPGSFLLSAMD